MMNSLRRTRSAAAAALAVLLAAACGDDESAGTTSAATSTGSGGGGSGGEGASGPGSGGRGGVGAAGGAGGGQGGMMSPIDGIADVEEIQSGFEFTEGPAWFAQGPDLLFSDIPPSRIHQLDEPGTITVFREPSGRANGNAIDDGGLLVTCEGGARQVTRTLGDGSIAVVASDYTGLALNAPNDVIVRSDGTIYFTDPNYGLDPADQEIAFQGVFRVTLAGDVELVSDQIGMPNGIALSPDEKTLYVTDSESDELFTFVVAADGTTSGQAKMLDSAQTPDGMAVDDDGNLYLTTQPGVEVYTPGGTLIGTIPVPEIPANCTFGGADRRTLYITARTGLYRVVTNVPGKP